MRPTPACVWSLLHSPTRTMVNWSVPQPLKTVLTWVAERGEVAGGILTRLPDWGEVVEVVGMSVAVVLLAVLSPGEKGWREETMDEDDCGTAEGHGQPLCRCVHTLQRARVLKRTVQRTRIRHCPSAAPAYPRSPGRGPAWPLPPPSKVRQPATKSIVCFSCTQIRCTLRAV